jgi:N-acetylglutamate synthase-like GNAT family acetyltransferase
VNLVLLRITTKTITPDISELLSYSTSEAKIVQSYEKYVNFPNNALYGFEFRRKFVGCIGIEFLEPKSCELKHIAVSPNHRGVGIGSKRNHG